MPIAPETATFVDVGSGMGRMVILAARRPFRRIVGVEISPALHEIARANLARYDDPRRQCRDIRLVRADASAFEYPGGDLAVYLYNPFRANVLEALLERLLIRPDRTVTILYHTPMERKVIEATGRFDAVMDLGYAVVYVSRPGAPSEPNW